DPFEHRGLNELVVGARERLGMRIVPAGRAGSGILRALRNNEVVALLIDIPQQGTGVNVEFFGAQVAVPDGPARLALRAGAPIFVALLPRLGPASDRFAAVVARVPFSATGDRDRDARELTQQTMRALEGTVRRHPEQWYIFRSLWVEDGEAGEAA
ncbi:MAG: lysophospholipid acyltransferase family protein, partial [Planctomycetes bacterium]|nr:lysophospholipid acyltransferase family protein [Planctomycetota bacterium]